MSLRQLVEAECGAQNPLMQFGSQIARDNTFKDDGISGAPGPTYSSREQFEGDSFASEYLQQMIAPPMTFQMDALLQEMREIEASDFQPQVINGPRVIDEVTKASDWASEFAHKADPENAMAPSAPYPQIWDQSGNMIHVQPVRREVVCVSEFFDVNQEHNDQIIDRASNFERAFAEDRYRQFANFVQHEPGAIGYEQNQKQTFEQLPEALSDNWLEDFEKNKAAEVEKSEDFNQKFWQKLEDEWKKLCDDDTGEHPWLTEFSDYYDPYKAYSFANDNPMMEEENALEKGKAFLARGDIPTAVLCFEAAVQKDSQNAEAWELLGISQAENEMDPHAIAALKKALELQPNNMKVLMALAVSYTNESLQSQALKMLTTWLHCHPKYKNLVPQNLLQYDEKTLTSSLIRGPELKEIQNLFLEAVKQNPSEIDSDIQEALGVLFNLSSEYDKAADCFRAALQVRPDNAKVWNRLGASFANGNRSVEAVDAYQRALQIEPGFIRARYNVGIICMNLKAYKEAAEHLLTALNLQATSSVRSGLPESTRTSQMSDTIWSTLRMVLSLMGRRDLQEVMDERDLNTLNKAFGDS